VLASEFTNIKTLLREAVESKLPGQTAHRLMLPHSLELNLNPDQSTIIQSSVLILLFPDNGKINTCLIRRPSTMRHHGGQIAFPGGRHEYLDKDLIQTALRESYEEIGTESNLIEILGALTPLYVQVSNFMINPFLGWSEILPDFKIDKSEVDELFIIPVEKFLLNTINQKREVNTILGTFNVPGYYINKLFIWGATAMIISEFKEIYSSLTV
jgi:8-oxo-dGTP pyrophosphatase MutT (NUDIX family)